MQCECKYTRINYKFYTYNVCGFAIYFSWICCLFFWYFLFYTGLKVYFGFPGALPIKIEPFWSSRFHRDRKHTDMHTDKTHINKDTMRPFIIWNKNTTFKGIYLSMKVSVGFLLWFVHIFIFIYIFIFIFIFIYNI